MTTVKEFGAEKDGVFIWYAEKEIEAFLDSLPHEAWEAGEDVLSVRDPEAYFGLTYRTDINWRLVRQIVEAVLRARGRVPRKHEQPSASAIAPPQ